MTDGIVDREPLRKVGRDLSRHEICPLLLGHTQFAPDMRPKHQIDLEHGLLRRQANPCAKAGMVMIRRAKAPAPNSRKLCMFQRKPNPLKIIAGPMGEATAGLRCNHHAGGRRRVAL